MNSGPYFGSLQGGGYHVYPDGRLLISGAHTLSDTARGFEGLYNLIWFSNTGYLDTTRVHRKGNGVVYGFKELPNGQFICAGTCTQFDGKAVDWFFRVNIDGTTDTTFRTGVNWGDAFTYLPLNDGRVYVGGNFRRGVTPQDTLKLVRFLPDGSIDPTFNAPHFTSGMLPAAYGPWIREVHAWGTDRLIVTGQFQYASGQPRRGICMIDTTGALLDVFDDCGVGPFTYMTSTYASVSGIIPDADSTHYYIWGAYTGYSDGVTNDTLQRFVTRLNVGDIGMGQEQPFGRLRATMQVYPNPTSGSATLQLDALPRNATFVVRDALGREVQRRRITDHYTTLALPDKRSGVFTVEVWDESGRIATERLVIE
ncbi:MAG TPA: T9SS type A sorting domain-containing protein [Flavobacteriales bacterium]|nr:T9SS type A sorting domain-containing protein [Flavobacteriales bacterium]